MWSIVWWSHYSTQHPPLACGHPPPQDLRTSVSALGTHARAISLYMEARLVVARVQLARGRWASLLRRSAPVACVDCPWVGVVPPSSVANRVGSCLEGQCTVGCIAAGNASRLRILGSRGVLGLRLVWAGCRESLVSPNVFRRRCVVGVGLGLRSVAASSCAGVFVRSASLLWECLSFAGPIP